MIPYDQAKSIGLLFDDVEADFPAINKFVKRLTDEGKKVRALTYFDRMQSSGYDFPFDYFTRDQVSTMGNLTSEKVGRFLDFEFDYLFCIQRHSFLPFDFILLHSKAKFRIGMYLETNADYFELMIRPLPEHSLEETLSQLLHYTQAVTTNGQP